MSQIIVIGAGIGGMAAAARLANSGHDVTVYERSDRIGGKCQREWIGNYAFDTGPSLLTLPAVYRDLFLKTGGALENVLEIMPVSPSFDYRFSDGVSLQFGNLSRSETLAEIARKIGPQASAQWNSLMVRAEKIWEVSRSAFIERELTSFFALFKRRTLLNDLRIIAPWKSLHKIAREKSTDYHLNYIVDRYATYSGSDPQKAPAALLSIAFVEEAFGAWHIKGGVGQLAEAIYQRALELGVRFHLNSEVREINENGTSVTGITLHDGVKVLADLVVANADSSEIYQKLLPRKLRLLKAPRRALARSEASLAGFSLLLGMRPDPNAQRLAHHTILFPKDYPAEFHSIFTLQKPVAEPTIYICAPHDPTMVVDEGHESWSILINAPRHSTSGAGWDWSDKKFAAAYAQEIISQIEKRGIAIRHRLEVLEIRTPADLESRVAAPGGSIYGTSSNGARAAFLRARNRSPLKGLFCVGGSAHPGGGLPLVGISAALVAQAIGPATGRG